jgi:hypothetical protein
VSAEEKAPEPIVFGDPVLTLCPDSGSVQPWIGQRAASDPWESYPGLWQIAIQDPESNGGQVRFVKLEQVRKANVPNEVLKLRCEP